MRFAVISICLLGLSATAAADRGWSRWTPPASCNAASSAQLLVLDHTITGCKVPRHSRVVRVHVTGVNVSARIKTVRRRHHATEVVLETTQICAGAAMQEDFYLWARIPSGKDAVTLVSVDGPRDPNPCLAP